MSGSWTARPGAFECIVTKFPAAPGHVFIESIHLTCIFLKRLLKTGGFAPSTRNCSVPISDMYYV